jgi:hypothetical protein
MRDDLHNFPDYIRDCGLNVLLTQSYELVPLTFLRGLVAIAGTVFTIVAGGTHSVRAPFANLIQRDCQLPRHLFVVVYFCPTLRK